MLLNNRIATFIALGKFLNAEQNFAQLKEWAASARNENGWFTEDNVLLSLKSIAENYLKEDSLKELSKNLSPKNLNPKKVGIVMAGNIPLVGFHDLLCVVLSGNIAYVKLSSTDSVLMKLVIFQLYELNSDCRTYIQIVEKLNDADAFIATGSDNSSKYFEYYFSKKPHIIRKNRTSVGVLTGEETKTDLGNLGNDIFQYFGLGCRNVSKLYVPAGYEFDKFFEAIEYWNTIVLHHKYNNNYDYNKSIYLVNMQKHLDNGFFLLREDEKMVSPLAVCFFEYYENDLDLAQKLKRDKDKIQCIVSKNGFVKGSFEFGMAQCPSIVDFADRIDTMKFLSEI